MGLFGLEPEILAGIWNSLFWGLSLSKPLRKRVVIAVPVLLYALHNLVYDVSGLLNTFNIIWNNCSLTDHLRKFVFDFGFLIIQRRVCAIFWMGSTAVEHIQNIQYISRYVSILRLQSSLNLWYLDLGKWLAYTPQKDTSFYYIHQQTLFAEA